MKKGKVIRILSLPFAFLWFVFLFVLNFAYILTAVVLVSAGLLSVPVGILCTVNVISVASDLAPPALAFAGGFCLFTGAAMGLSLGWICPASAVKLHKYIRWYKPFLKQGSLAIRHSLKAKGYMKLLFGLGIASLIICAGCQIIAINTGFQSTFISERLEFEGVNYINVNTTNLDLTIKTYDGDKIIAEYENDSPIVSDTSDNSKLKLTQSDDFTLSLFSMKMFSYKMTLYIPENNYRELYFGSISGDVRVEGVVAEYLELDTKSGDIYADNLNSKVSVNTESGKVKLSFNAFLNTANITSGNGNTEIILPDFAAVKLDFITNGGRFTSDLFEKKYNSRIGDVSEEFGKNPFDLNVTSDTGNLEIMVRE